LANALDVPLGLAVTNDDEMRALHGLGLAKRFCFQATIYFVALIVNVRLWI
jgi:hypothetical protein